MCFDYCKEELKSVTKSSRSHLYKLLIAAANCEKNFLIFGLERKVFLRKKVTFFMGESFRIQ